MEASTMDNEYLLRELKRKEKEIEALKQKIKGREALLKQKDEELKALLKQKDDKLKKIDDELEALQKDAELKKIEEKLKERSLKSILETFAVKHDRTQSGPLYPKKHKHADVTQTLEMTKDFVDEIKKQFVNDTFRRAPFVKDPLANIDSEVDVQFAVRDLLKSILTGLGLHKVVDVVSNRTLAGTECDLLLIYDPIRLPFAVVEVKKPGVNSDERKIVWQGKVGKSGTMENRIAGELYDELMALSLFGYGDSVVGMLATWNHSRLASTGELGDAADNKSFITDKARDSLDRVTGNIVARQVDDAATPPHPPRVVDASTRKLTTSNIVPDPMLDCTNQESVDSKVAESGEEIICLFVLFVLKACKTLDQLLSNANRPTESNLQISKRMPCRVLDADETRNAVFGFGTVKVESGEVKLKNYSIDLKTIHIIRHLGSGGNGNCCLGISQGGKSSCVVKFFHRPPKGATMEDLAMQELHNWKCVYGQHKYLGNSFASRVIGRGGNKPCLVMPYFFPIAAKDRGTILNNGTIRTSLRLFADSGFVHNDIKWDHFRWFAQGEEVVLIDLGTIGEVVGSMEQKEKKIAAWVEKAIRELKTGVGPLDSPKNATEPPTKKKRNLCS